MGKGGGGSLGDSKSSLWSLAININFRRCYTVAVQLTVRMGGTVSFHSWHVSRYTSLAVIILFSYCVCDYITSGLPSGDNPISSRSLRTRTTLPSHSKTVFLALHNTRISAHPRLQVVTKAPKKWHQCFGKSCNSWEFNPNPPTHSA